MNNVTIEVAEPGDQGLFGTDEVWVTVTGPDPLPDYQKIRAEVKTRHGLFLQPTPLRFYPSWGETPDEPYQELWVTRRHKVVLR